MGQLPKYKLNGYSFLVNSFPKAMPEIPMNLHGRADNRKAIRIVLKIVHGGFKICVNLRNLRIKSGA